MRERHREPAPKNFRDIVQNAPEVVMLTDADASVLYVNGAVTGVLGYEPEDMVGGDLAGYVHPSEKAGLLAPAAEKPRVRLPAGGALEFRMRHADGSWRQVEAVAACPSDDGLGGYEKALYIRDASGRDDRAELERRASEDPLTGLANRGLFMVRLEHAMARNARQQTPVAVLFLDVDDLKAINDTLGHKAGDRLLVAIGRRLRACTRPGDTAARLGGDEFTVLVEDASGRANAVRLAERLLGTLTEPIALGDHTVFVSVSIGVAMSSPGLHEAENLLHAADTAMYRAKREGKGRYEVFDDETSGALISRLGLETELWRALERSEFELHYRPVVYLKTDEVVGMEAVVRWNHPESGLLLPDAFIPVAEKNDLMIPIGRWLLETACAHAKEWRAAGLGSWTSLGVNLSAAQLAQPDLTGVVAHVLRKTGYPASGLVLEITESMIEDTRHVEETLGALEALDVRLAIDGFGTGFSSLSNLANLPIHALKVDRSFVDLLDGRRDKTLPIVSATLGIARTLGIATVADGVETREQASMLREIGCDAGQGSYFSGPLPFGAACEFLGARERRGYIEKGRRYAGPVSTAESPRKAAAGWTDGEGRERPGEKRRDEGRPR